MPIHSKQKGLTLVELLIVIALIGILAVVAITILNPKAQNNRASDGVRLSKMDQIVEGITTFQTAEQKLPVDSNGDGNPVNDSNGLSIYLSDWPNSVPAGATYTYWTNGTEYGVVVIKTDGVSSFKYRSDWAVPKISNCSNLTASSSTC